jgi:hypothetical protein
MKKKFRETKLNFCETKRNFTSIFVVRNKTKFRIFLFHETSEIFAKQARLSYRFVFREINKKAKIKNPKHNAFEQGIPSNVMCDFQKSLVSSLSQQLPWAEVLSVVVCFVLYLRCIIQIFCLQDNFWRQT